MNSWSGLLFETLRRRWLHLILVTLIVITLAPSGSDAAYIALLGQAQTAVQSNQPEAALAALQQAFEIQPATPPLRYLAADSALRANQIALAETYLTLPHQGNQASERAGCLQARLHAARARLDLLRRELEGLGECPAALEAIHQLARSAFEEGRWDQAEDAAELLGRHGAIDPELALLLIQLEAARNPTHALDQLRSWQRAGQSLTPTAASLLESLRSAAVQEDRAFQHALVGQTFARHRAWQLAAVAFENSIAIDPGYTQARAYYGLALERSGQDGKDEILAAYEMDPESPLPLAFLASLLLEEGKTNPARALMERAARLTPRDPALLTQLAAAQAADGDLTRARATLLQAVELAPQESGIWLALANLSVQSEVDLQEVAVPAARQALLLAPHSPSAADTLGYAHLLSGHRSLAERLFRRALRSDPRLTSAWYHLGLASLEEGDSAAARVAFEHVQELEPGSATSELARRALSRLP